MNFDHAVADLPQATMNHTVLGFTITLIRERAMRYRATIGRYRSNGI